MSKQCLDGLKNLLLRAISYGYLPSDFTVDTPSDNLQGMFKSIELYMNNGELSKEELSELLQMERDIYNSIYEFCVDAYKSQISKYDEEALNELNSLTLEELLRKIRGLNSDFYFYVVANELEAKRSSYV